MRRRAKGTTRTGAIPFCMADVTPTQSRTALWDRLFAQLAQSGDEHRERALLAPSIAPIHAAMRCLAGDA